MGSEMCIRDSCGDDRRYHIKHPKRSSEYPSSGRHGPTPRVFPPGAPRHNRLAPIKVSAGPLTPPPDPQHIWHDEDEWGAGMLFGNLMVGFSRAGRVFICSNWRQAIESSEKLIANSVVVECETDGSSFDLGGWLSVKDHRVMFEIEGSIYIIALSLIHI